MTYKNSIKEPICYIKYLFINYSLNKEEYYKNYYLNNKIKYMDKNNEELTLKRKIIHQKLYKNNKDNIKLKSLNYYYKNREDILIKTKIRYYDKLNK
jgi:hypothetical protein